VTTHEIIQIVLFFGLKLNLELDETTAGKP